MYASMTVESSNCSSVSHETGKPQAIVWIRDGSVTLQIAVNPESADACEQLAQHLLSGVANVRQALEAQS